MLSMEKSAGIMRMGGY